MNEKQIKADTHRHADRQTNMCMNKLLSAQCHAGTEKINKHEQKKKRHTDRSKQKYEHLYRRAHEYTDNHKFAC